MGRNLFFLLLIVGILSGCASSKVSRNVSSGVDMVVQNAKNLYDSASQGDLANTYQNASQTTKGVMIGGATGAVTGALSSSVGFIPGTALGAIFGATYGSYIEANASLEDKLINRGANIIVLGDQILIVLPATRLFNPLTSTISPTAFTTLTEVAQYINQYTKILVKVSAYTNDSGTSTIDKALSQEQATRVAKFLAESGVDARILYAEGYGGTHLVEPNSLTWSSDNNRIEITLEKLYL